MKNIKEIKVINQIRLMTFTTKISPNFYYFFKWQKYCIYYLSNKINYPLLVLIKDTFKKQSQDGRFTNKY